MGRRLFFVTTSLALGIAFTGARDVRAERPLHEVTYQTLTVGRVNPLGLIFRGWADYRYRLYASDSPVFENNFIGAGAVAQISPSFSRVGARVQLQPAAFVQLGARYEVVGYYGNFELFQSFPSVLSEHSDTRLDTLSEAPEPEQSFATHGSELTLSVLLQGKVGPVALRNGTRFVRGDYELRDGDRVYYDVVFDVMAPNEGWFVVNDLDLLYVSDFGLVAGARWTATHAFYGGTHYASLSERGDNPNTPMHRLGPMVAYTFYDEEGQSFFDEPTILVLGQWWLAHRYRTGEDVSQAIPWVVFGFAFGGDLLPRA